jgi:hypothetical protein
MERISSPPILAPQITEARLRQLYAYWMERKGDRRFPSTRDVDPLDLSYVVGSIMLVDVLREPLKFCLRLHGTEMVSRAAYDLTGKLLDDLPATDFRAYVIERCKSVVETGDPVLVHRYRILGGRHRHYEALWLPFSEDGATVTMLLCGLIYQDRKR